MTRVHLIGASGRTGRAVGALLAQADCELVAIGRTRERLFQVEAAEHRLADAEDVRAMRAALADARRVVTTLHARHVPALLGCLSGGIERIVALGSTRAYTRFPDDAAEAVRRAERALQNRSDAVLLHPTMIYGAAGENNIARVVRYLRRTRFVPLPRRGLSLIQPVHQDDVARAVVAALLPETAAGPPPIVVAGPAAMTYAEFVRAVGRAIGREPRIVPAPAAALMAMAAMTRVVPGVPTIRPDEVRRLLEDKAFDVEPLRTRLGIEPITFEEGLRRSLATEPIQL